MGSWGIEVLENDTALDLIPSLVKNGSLKRTVERLLLSAEYIDERLLAVEIVDISLKIDTYDISTQPYEDCCTTFVAKHPVTKPNLNVIKHSELKLADKIDEMIEEAVRTVEVLDI